MGLRKIKLGWAIRSAAAATPIFYTTGTPGTYYCILLVLLSSVAASVCSATGGFYAGRMYENILVQQGRQTECVRLDWPKVTLHAV